MNDDLLLPITFDGGFDDQPASAEELALIASLLPEIMKELLADPETEEG